jgi:DNA modification methylase
MVLDQCEGRDWSLYNADCIEGMRGLGDASVDYVLFSPPFVSLYTFSDNPRDLSNCRDAAQFWEHYSFVVKDVFRLLKPGRLLSIHCMDLPTSLFRDGAIAIRDFPGDNIRLAEQAGFLYHSRVCIWKDPVIAMQRTKALGLLHKQLVKDSIMSRMGIADYIVTMRKPGTNKEPVAGRLLDYIGDDTSNDEFTATVRVTTGRRSLEDHKSISIWQRYASPVWMDIDQSETLSAKLARDQRDERHIAPLQLTPIRRCLSLWTNPADVVFSPFAGIGSVGYVSLELGRKFVGFELKPSYYRQAVANLQSFRRGGFLKAMRG